MQANRDFGVNWVEKQAAPKPRQRRYHYGYVILVVSILANMAGIAFARMSYPLLLPAMKESLGLTYGQAGLIATGNFIGYLIASVVAGALAAKYGFRIVSSVALLLSGIFMAVTGVSNSFVAALTSRVATGGASAATNIPVMAVPSAWFAPSKRGLATGITVMGGGIGCVILGWAVPAALLNYGADGWRYSWYVLGIASIVIAVITLALGRNTPQEMGLQPVGASPQNGNNGVSNAQTLSGMRDVYRSKPLINLGVVYATWCFSYTVYATFFVAYLVDERSFDVLFVGFLWSLSNILSIVSGLWSGWLSDKWGRKATMVFLMIIYTLSYGLLAIKGPVEFLYMSVILYGLAGAGMPTVTAAAAGDYVGARRAPAAVGYIILIMGVGQAIGPSVAGYVIDMTYSFVGALLLAMVIGAIGTLLTVFLKPPPTQE